MSEETLPKQTFNLAIGQAKTVEFTLETAPESSVAGWSVAFYLRSRSGAVLLTKTTGSGITCTDGDAGVWDVAIASADTDAFSPGLANWSFWRTDDGSETPLAVGTCEVYRTSRSG